MGLGTWIPCLCLLAAKKQQKKIIKPNCKSGVKVAGPMKKFCTKHFDVSV